jgi:Holliday junction resolvase
MPNSNRQRGDYFERQTRDALEAHGWFVIRAAGSYGPADIVALRAGNTPLLVSCKLSGSIGPEERAVLTAHAEQAGARPVLAQRKKSARVTLSSVPDKTELAELRVPKRYTKGDEQ